MKNFLYHIILKMRDFFWDPILWRINQQSLLFRTLADSNFQTRALLKRSKKQAIKVLFVCHEPAMWGSYDSVYRAMEADPQFSPLVISLPYHQTNLPGKQFKDAGMLEFLQKRNISAIKGCDNENNEWLNPASFEADYIFLQTPYRTYPPEWSIEQLSLIAKVCYVPYGSLIEKGRLIKIVFDDRFFRYVSLFFIENRRLFNIFKEQYKDSKWYDEKRVIVSGHPKLDFVQENKKYTGAAWKLGLKKGVKRIVWTPRWTTSDGTCTFFDYKDFFKKFCTKNKDVDFIFRPHFEFFQNFIKTGEITLKEKQKIISDYDSSQNMSIDTSASYEDTFMTSDLLVSDLSSMLLEYFATGKPVIYTHRENLFNDYGLTLAEGLYWARNAKELDYSLSSLLSGVDPLRKKREELMKDLFFMPEGGAGRLIKEKIWSDFMNY